MNKVLIGSILACGLLLLESPEAVAHDEKGRHHRSPANYHAYDYRRDSRRHDYRSRNTYSGERYDNRNDRRHKRAKKMPNWLKHDRSFRRWLDATRLDRNRYVTWHQLFEIYSWEYSYPRNRRY